LTSDPLDILIAHHRWGTKTVLDACVALSEDQFHRRFEMGVGSLHDTLLHIVRCVEGWTARVQDVDWPRQPESTHRVAELIEMNDESVDRLADLVAKYRREDALGIVVSKTFYPADASPIDVRFTRGAAITHCLVHGTHHRAQALNMLRQLGVAPLPELDVMDWHHEEDLKS
jgi:uncharacterized damage-inducible protein DinB